jgi:hypothetical protein
MLFGSRWRNCACGKDIAMDRHRHLESRTPPLGVYVHYLSNVDDGNLPPHYHAMRPYPGAQFGANHSYRPHTTLDRK